MTLTLQQQETLRELIQNGLPLVTAPYQTLAEQIGSAEQDVIDCIERWNESGLIKRFGLVVNHNNIGYRANAMVVWDVPDGQLEKIAGYFVDAEEVTLCYQRPRILPQWPYNLFCMIHGTNRDQVLAQISALVDRNGLHEIQRDVLFSYKQFKQCGGRFVQSILPSSASSQSVSVSNTDGYGGQK